MHESSTKRTTPPTARRIPIHSRPTQDPRRAERPATDTPQGTRQPSKHAVLPVVFLLVLFAWEAVRFSSVGVIFFPICAIVCAMAAVAVLPLERTSRQEAWRIYAWFLFISAAVAYADYEVMLDTGLWFSDRSQDDPGKYWEWAQCMSSFREANDPGYVLFLSYLWQGLRPLGEPHYLALLNCQMAISSLFAVCCLEVSRIISPRARILPYLFIFNPTVVAVNAMLMRDALLGALGWSAVLFGLALATRDRRSPFVSPFWAFGFLSLAAAVYHMRTISGAFFFVATVIIAGGRGRTIRTAYVLIMSLMLLAYFGALTGEGMLLRGASSVERSQDLVNLALDDGSVGARLLGGVLGRTTMATGSTVVYGMPFWRVSSPALVSESLFSLGSLCCQLFTALPLLCGLIDFVRRPRPMGCALLVVYAGWLVASAIMLQVHVRYNTSHVLPILMAVGAHGADTLRNHDPSVRRMLYVLLLGVFLCAQVLIDLIKAGY
jgi:hypothetical protein